MSSCSQSELNKDLIGSWEGIQSVSTRYLDDKNNFYFINDSLPVLISIKNDRTVLGNIGNSKFIKCRVSRNTNWFGKNLHIGTENVISGFLL